MPINSSVYTRSKNWTDDRDNTIKIRADRHDEHDDDIATALNAIMAGTAGFIGPTFHFSGTLANPGLSWNGDSDTGFYRPAANTIGVATGGALALTVAPNQTITYTGTQKWSKGTAIDDTDVDGSNILTFPTDGNSFDFTGTQQVDEIATVGVGTIIRTVHLSARQLTHHATNLVLPGGVNYTTASGDVFEWLEYAAGDWRCVGYALASGKALVVDTPTPPTPSGAVMPFAMETAPSGWLECDGSAVSRTTYASLFTAISTIFGSGDGSTTFNLPDLRGQFVRGWDHTAGTDPDAGSRTDSGDGSTTGDNVGTKQGHAFETHRHRMTLNRYYGNASAGSKGWGADNGNQGAAANDTDTNPQTGTYSSETRPINVALMYCIKT